MTIHVLVEGPSERALLERWSRRLLRGQRLKVHPHQGKGVLPTKLDAAPLQRHRGLLDQLPAKLRGFSNSLDPTTDGVVVVVDADNDDPAELRARITEAAQKVAPNLRVTVQLAVEETEAFYLGDLKALASAFPHADMKRARAYLPDSVCGTWELFGEIVGDRGANEVAWAEAMGPVLTITASKSRSPSFRALVNALNELSPRGGSPRKQKRFRHVPRSSRDSSGRR